MTSSTASHETFVALAQCPVTYPARARAGGAAPVAGRSGIERDQEMTARTRVGVSRFFIIDKEKGCISDPIFVDHGQ